MPIAAIITKNTLISFKRRFLRLALLVFINFVINSVGCGSRFDELQPTQPNLPLVYLSAIQ